MSWFKRLKDGLKKSSTKVTESITAVIKKRKLDDAVLEELEESLIQADLGVSMAAQVCAKLAKTRFNQEVSDDEVKQVLAEEIINVLEPKAKPLTIDSTHKPFVILVVGVNGSGKTTTIGKLGKNYQAQGFKVRFVAGDTFRAAAVEQLQEWGQRFNIPVSRGAANSDAAALAYSAIEEAKSAGEDIVLVDTAGRLQNKANLMEELSKIVRVIKKFDPSAPHSCLLVLDATTGQNAHSQVKLFGEIAGLTGLVMTKLDGTARGGVLVSLAKEFDYPIHAIGVGEKADDLQPFSAQDFANQLVGLDQTQA
jgi:fused signal recognition particle receptor